MKTKVIIFGSEGQMGKAAVWAAKQMGHFDVHTADIVDVQAKFAIHHWFLDPGYPDYHTILQSDKPDIVISCMPYHQNLALAKECISRKIFYCDLGGSVPVSKEINRLAKEADSFVLTDLGLAPGLVNIIAEYMVKNSITTPDSVTMLCGGLPVNPKNKLKYYSNWSVDGLLNEYYDNCLILKDGQETIVNGLDGLYFEDMISDKTGCSFHRLESFYTSGGLSHSLNFFKDSGIRNACYKTMCYPGHVNQLKTMTEDEIKEDIKHNGRYIDVVFIKVILDGINQQNTQELAIEASDRFTAMQRATSFSLISSVVNAYPYYVANTAGHFSDRPQYYSDYLNGNNVVKLLQSFLSIDSSDDVK